MAAVLHNTGWDEGCEQKRKRQRQRLLWEEEQREKMAAGLAIEEERRVRRANQERALAEAVAVEKHNRTLQEKKMQHLHHTNDELRDLQEKINIAKMAKLQAEQRQEAQRLAAIQQQKDKEEEERIVAHQNAVDTRRKDEAKHRRVMAENCRAGLQQQMEDKEMMRLHAMRSHMEEKDAIDEIVRQMHAADQKDRDVRAMKQKETQESFQRFLSQRAEIKQKEREQLEEEDRKILEHITQQNQRVEQQKAKEQAKFLEQQRILEQQTRQLADDRRQRDETDNLLQEYYMAMQEDKEEKAEQARRARAMQQRDSMIRENELNKRMKAYQAQQQRDEDEAYSRRLQEKFAEDEMSERENAVKRREARSQHAAELQSFIQDRKDQRTLQRQAELDEIDKSQQAAAEEKRVVEQERLRMLAEGADLLQYLPKGVLKAGDLERLGLA